MDEVILNNKNFNEESLFKPENLLREAKRQKNIINSNVPEICILDPDGDILRYLKKNGQTEICPYWACYHTELFTFMLNNVKIGMIGNAVGSSFAVLLAEQLFVSGCKLLISITSAGMINQTKNNSKFILIESSLRDEGTSYHYLSPEKPALINNNLLNKLLPLISNPELSLETGKSWTTDAPYRETLTSITSAKNNGIVTVEMEASALYSYAIAKNKDIICYAHITNNMAQNGDDFEKGIENGSIDSLKLISSTIIQLKNENCF